LPIRIYSMIKHGSPTLINALSTILLLVTFLLVWFSQKLTEEPTR
jgi:ABC-type spermidine/putrescine transport system permease subunit II